MCVYSCCCVLIEFSCDFQTEVSENELETERECAQWTPTATALMVILVLLFLGLGAACIAVIYFRRLLRAYHAQDGRHQLLLSSSAGEWIFFFNFYFLF